MAFNDMFSSRASALDGTGSKKYMSRQGARTKFMTGKQAIVFGLLPAFDPQNSDASTSWWPSILPDGQLSSWGFGFWVARGIGHGSWKDRVDIVDIKQFGKDCPLSALYAAIRTDRETWGYLNEDKGKWGDPNRESAALPKPRQLLAANVYIPGEPERLAQVGFFTKTIAAKLLDGDTGIVFAPDPKATEEQIAANYLAAYANGDVTDPNNCPLFCVEKGHDKGDMSAYDIRFQPDANRRIMRCQVTQQILAARYDMAKPETFLNILEPEEMANLLIDTFNGRSPAGYHEYALLRRAFGDKFKVPEPPSAPGAVPSIQSGFEPDPTPPPMKQAAPMGVVHVAPQPGIPSAVPMGVVNVAPANPPGVNSAEMAAVASAAAAAGVGQAPVKPTVPGDAIKPFNREAFLAGFKKD